jgi:glutathione S-transferase kappa 1
MAAQKAAHHCVFFYDVLSPYSYLAFEVLMRFVSVLSFSIPRRTQRVLSFWCLFSSYKKVWSMSVELKPFHLGAIMKESGNRPPGLVPAKVRVAGQAPARETHVTVPAARNCTWTST